MVNVHLPFAIAEIEKNNWQIYNLTTEEGQEFRIPYMIDGGKINEMNMWQTNLIVKLNATDLGNFEISLPRNLIDSKRGVVDDSFVVLLDSNEIKVNEKSNPCLRTISGSFSNGANELEFAPNYGHNPEGPKTSIPPIQIYSNATYHNGQTAIIEGCTSLATNDGDVIIDVSDSSGNIITTLAVTPEIDGTFSTNFVIDDKSNNGNYAVSATYGNYTAIPEFPITILVLIASVLPITLLMRTKLHDTTRI
jgi:predicted secreted protein with PEFG-CTERM motif